MLVGSQYSNDRMYRGIKHYDKLPLLSEDIHEYADTVYVKNAHIMNNIIGHGILNAPSMTRMGDTFYLSEPLVLLLDGDIALIHPTGGLHPDGKSAGVGLCLIGWYQEVTADSVIHTYGGLYNDILENRLADNEWGVQVSSRYQFVWFITDFTPDTFSETSVDLDTIMTNRQDINDLLSISHFNKKIGNDVYVLECEDTEGMSLFSLESSSDIGYVIENTLYMVPILDYDYNIDEDVLLSASLRLPISPKGSAGFIKSDEMPAGEYLEGTTWYNPTTREFKTYVKGEGFVDSTSTMGFLQYQSVHVIPEDITEEQDIRLDIDISELQEGDILQVAYEGLVLVPDEQYTVDYRNHQVTLLGFTAEQGDRVYFTATRIMEANDITNITQSYLKHVATTGSGSVEGHVKLSDDIDITKTASAGVAATPKAVYESRLVSDNKGNKYRFGVEDGLLYIEEV